MCILAAGTSSGANCNQGRRYLDPTGLTLGAPGGKRECALAVPIVGYGGTEGASHPSAQAKRETVGPFRNWQAQTAFSLFLLQAALTASLKKKKF